jgi:hypothetical protein
MTISAVGSNDPDVYIINDAGYKRLFINPIIFNMYGQLGGFADVHSVSAAVRDAFPTSGLFRNCEANTQAVYGLEVTGEDTGVLHWVNVTGDQAVAQDPNFFQKVFCINNNEFNWYTNNGTNFGANYSSISQIPNYSRTPGVTPTYTPIPSGPISVSLAYDNPPSGTLVKSQAAADLAHFQFTGNSVVTNIQFNRIGISADTDLANVYLYDGVKRLTDAASVTNGQITFNDTSPTGLFTVNGSRVISVRSDLSSSTGETVGIQLVRVNGNAVNISGNLFTVANATLATVVLSNGTTPAANNSLDPASDVVVWQDTATIGTRYVWMKSLQIRVIGSVYVGDLQNFRLLVDGVQQGQAISQSDANGYVVFDLSGAPVKLETGGRVLKVLADVINGSSRNFTASLRQAPDIFVVDNQYGQNVLATVLTGSFPDSAGEQTISSGTLTFTRTQDSPSGDVVKGASGVTLARFELKANGEKMKAESLRANVTYAPLGVTGAKAAFTLRNGALFVYDEAAGVSTATQIGSTAALCGSGNHTCSGYSAAASLSYTSYSLGSSLIVEPGHPKIIEIRADAYDDGDATALTSTDTLVANFAIGSTNVQSLTSLAYTNGPTAAKAGNILTVKTGSFSVAKYTGYANQSAVTPSNGVKIGHFTLIDTSTEDINVNTITFDVDQSGNIGATSITDAYIKVYNDTGSVIYTSPSKASISVSASNSYSVNFVIPKNKTYQVEVWGNIAAGLTATTDYFDLNLDASGITTSSSTTATATQATGQVITIRSGSLNTANGAVPAARLINGGQRANVYSFTITPTYDDYTLDEVYVDIASGTVASNSGAVANLYLTDGSTTLGTATLNSLTGSASFTGLNYPLLQSAGTKTLYVDVQFASVGGGANDTGGSVTMQLDGLKYRSSGGTVTTSNGLSTSTYTGSAFYDVKGYPTFTNAALPTTVLAPGLQTLFRTDLSATGGQIAWNDITFTVASNSANGTFGPAATGWKLYENGSDITGFATVASVSDIGATTRVEFVFGTERAVAAGSSVRLELKTTVGGTLATGDYVTTQIANPSTTTVTTLSSTVQYNKGASFVWTDQSHPIHTTATDDWFTDGMVKSLIDSQTLTK